MSAAALIAPHDRRALRFLFAEWHDLAPEERTRRIAKAARRLRAALEEERSGYVDDAAFLFAVGASLGLPLPSAVPQGRAAAAPPAPSRPSLRDRTRHWAVAAIVLLVLVALAPFASRFAAPAGEPIVLVAYGPLESPPSPDAAIRRIAVNLAVVNRSHAPVFVSPLQFRARDSASGYHRANVDATLAVGSYRLLASGPGGADPMAAATLRSGDSLAGYVVFDVPAGLRLTQIVLTAGDRELTVDVPVDRYSLARP